MSDDLLPCPFCGASGRVYGLGPYFVSCVRMPNCAGMTNLQRTAETAIAIWNYREAAPLREVVVDEAMVDRGWDGLTEHRGTFEGEQPITRDDIRAALTAALTHPQGDNTRNAMRADPGIEVGGTTHGPLKGDNDGR